MVHGGEMTDDPAIMEACDGLQLDEITVLESIYPEGISIVPNVQDRPGRLAHLIIPITFDRPIATRLLPSVSPLPRDDRSPNPNAGPSTPATSLSISHVPPIILRVLLPPTYPVRSPPKTISIRAPLSILPAGVGYLAKPHLKTFQDRLLSMWEEDREQSGGEGIGVLWRYYEWISSGEAFRDLLVLYEDKLSLTIPPNVTSASFLAALQAYDSAQHHADFESTAYSCGICLDSRPGHKCVRMPNCGCVFCNECLNACWTLAITEGSLENVGCPSVDCVKARSARKPGEARDEVTAETVESVVGEELRGRWETLKEMRLAEIDPRYTTCPQPGCQATVPPPPDPPPSAEVTSNSASSLRVVRLADLKTPARPTGNLPTPPPTPVAAAPSTAEDRWARYRCCPSCHFSFCTYCSSSWHGAHTACQFPQTSVIVREYLSYPENSPERRRMEVQRGKANLERMVARFHEDEENRKWLEAQTIPCAGCGVRVEKSHGCNHMTCGRCGAHFCFRCGASLRPTDPYVHYNTPGSSCFEKLFDAAEIARYEREAEHQREQVAEEQPWANGNAEDLAAELAALIQIQEFDDFEARQAFARRRGVRGTR